MELQSHLKSDWSPYFYHQPPMEFDTRANYNLLCGELQSSSASLEEDHSDPYRGIWTDAEQARVKGSSNVNRSFAMDARMRLDSLKSGCNSLLDCCAMDGMLYNYKCQKESEEPEEEECALDSVELIDVEEVEQDEESWLYESRKKPVLEERTESAVGWCRHVLDNPSPEMEAACRRLKNKLDQKSGRDFYRRPVVFYGTGNVSVDKTPVRKAHHASDSLDNNELNTYNDSITTSYRLHDMTDVHIMARMQEASLREGYGSPPDTASQRRGPQPGLSSPRSVAKQDCQSPKLARLQQQVTQFKLLKLAQKQATSPGRARSPLRTSLRSLQAVRNSRSMDTEDYQPADQITQPPTVSPGASSVRQGSSCWSPSFSAGPSNSNGLLRPARDSSARVQKLKRSQSASPCRIPHPAKAHLSVNGRVFASPDRSTNLAWGRNVLSTQR